MKQATSRVVCSCALEEGHLPVQCMLLNCRQREGLPQALAPSARGSTQHTPLQKTRELRQRAVAGVHAQAAGQHLDQGFVIPCKCTSLRHSLAKGRWSLGSPRRTMSA